MKTVNWSFSESDLDRLNSLLHASKVFTCVELRQKTITRDQAQFTFDDILYFQTGISIMKGRLKDERV